MFHLTKLLTAASAFLFVAYAHAATQNDLTHLRRDACEFWGIGEAEGEIQSCSQIYTCSNGYNYVFKYQLSGSSSTQLTAFCKIESSGSLETCEQDPLTFDLALCFNNAIDQGLLRNQTKLRVPTPGFVPNDRQNVPSVGVTR